MTGFFEGADNNPVVYPHSLGDHLNVDTDIKEDGSVLSYDLATATWKGAPPIAVPAGSITFATVAEMAVAVLDEGTLVFCLDYADGNNAGVLKFEAVPIGTGTADGGSYIDGVGVQWKQLFTGGTRSVKQWGAVGDGVTDNLPIFQAIDASSYNEFFMPDGNYFSTNSFGTQKTFILASDAEVTIDDAFGDQWFPKLWWKLDNNQEIRKLNKEVYDPGIVITGDEYVNIEEGLGLQAHTINQWGSQPADINDTSLGRTTVDVTRFSGSHIGEGDFYINRCNGFIQRHARHEEIANQKGHNNVGLYNGQVNAGTDQVTLYGCGDMVLQDNGYDNVALRGQVTFLYANGQRNTPEYPYPVDRFGYYMKNRGVEDIDGFFIASGPGRAALDTSKAVLSDNAALNMAADQKIFFNASGADSTSGYTATVSGDYSIGMNSVGENLELNSKNNYLRMFDGITTLSSSASQASSLRAYETHPIDDTSTPYCAIGCSGNFGFVTAASGGTNDVSLVLRSQQAGVPVNGMTIKPDGRLNVTNLPVYADDTAAASLPAGDIYRTATGELRIKL